MTKLKLNLAHGAGEILTREELKKVLGGTGSGSGSGGEDPCAGLTTSIKCTEKDPDGGNDIIISRSTGIGCPTSNTCPSGQFMSCSCIV